MSVCPPSLAGGLPSTKMLFCYSHNQPTLHDAIPRTYGEAHLNIQSELFRGCIYSHCVKHMHAYVGLYNGESTARKMRRNDQYLQLEMCTCSDLVMRVATLTTTMTTGIK